jgi:cysteine synthase A
MMVERRDKSTMFSLPRPTADLVIGILLGTVAATFAASTLRWTAQKDSKGGKARTPDCTANRHGVANLVGKTPILKLESLSDELGVQVVAKAEFLNPGGSSKDRVALAIIESAELSGRLVRGRGDTVYEGTVGSTGISLALVCKALGYNCWIVMPDDQAKEKYALLESLNATVERVRPCPISDPNHYVNVARRRAAEVASAAQGNPEVPSAIFADQFENPANWKIHYSTTGPEIDSHFSSLPNAPRISMFVMAAGTGGTLSGASGFLKANHNPALITVLADPSGSGLFHKVKHGIVFAGDLEKEGTRKRHQVDTLVEGVGINRLTANFSLGLEKRWINDAVRVSDAECVRMARYMVEKEGLFLGSSSCVNLVGTVKAVKERGWCGQRDKVVVTVLCDGGQRHLTKFWSREWLAAWFKEEGDEGAWSRDVNTVWDVLD